MPTRLFRWAYPACRTNQMRESRDDMLRISQVVVISAIVPMMCLGVMSAMSGGGAISAFQEIGGRLMRLSPWVGLTSVGASWLLERLRLKPLAYAVLVVPIVMWVVMVADLHRRTNFFSTAGTS